MSSNEQQQQQQQQQLQLLLLVQQQQQLVQILVQQPLQQQLLEELQILQYKLQEQEQFLRQPHQEPQRLEQVQEQIKHQYHQLIQLTYQLPLLQQQQREQLRPIDPNDLKPPVEVQLPVGWDTISFIGPDKWRENIVEEINELMLKEETDTYCIPPMAFVRCSRGGKTRALLETASMLKAQSPGLAVIYVSFNNLTDLIRSETDGLAALRRRIAYYSLKEAPKNNDAFGDYRRMDFLESNLLNWLGNSKCVLFVDELNLLGDRLNSELADFIKSRFLARKGRYFVFSSHKATTAVDLSNFMESQSNRGVLTPGLPLVTNVQKARDSLHWQSMSARDLIIYGGIPGLLVEAHKNGPPSLKRNKLIKSVIQSNNVNMGVIRVILGTFVTGDYEVLPPQLLELMDVTPRKPLKVKWIPFHLMELMKDLGRLMSLPLSTRYALSEVETLFLSLATSKKKSGEAWEALFVVVLLIRCLSGLVDSTLLSLHGMSVARVSYNYLMDSSKTFWPDVTNVNDLLNMIPKKLEKDKSPHIAIYYPPNPNFELFDVFVVRFNASGERGQIIGYQFKEGKGKPNKGSATVADVSIVIIGDTSDGSSGGKGWLIASEEEINEFFGENARLWTPKHWKEYSRLWFDNQNKDPDEPIQNLEEDILEMPID
ncbi:hypothetical protein MP638_002009 [Amoeboaphelidium occidentale]|nr:hypothetical protein MP638_002009 [Amoeboaphelidium occidentale]